MFGKFFKTVIGLALVPVAIAAVRAFFLQISTLGSFKSTLLILERGVLSYLLFHVLIVRPVNIYVFGHECVHVLATWLCGGRVESFNVSQSGGHVATSKTNVFIELSPYFIPIYTLLLGPAFMLVKTVVKDAPNLNPLFLFLVGVTLAFHFVMTSEVLRMHQPDVSKSGLILSLVVIFVFNLIVTMAVFCPFFGSLSFMAFVKSIVAYSKELYALVYESVLGILFKGYE